MTDPALARLLLVALLGVVTAPTPDEVAVLGSWMQDGQPLAGRFSPSTISHMQAKDVLEVPITEVYWPFASVRGDEAMFEAVRSYTEGSSPDAYRADAPGDGARGEVVVLVDGEGGLHEHSRHVIGSNRHGLSYLRTRVATRPIKCLSVLFGADPGVLRLDWLRLRVLAAGSAAPADVKIGPHDSLDALAVTGTVMPGTHVIISETTSPAIAYVCPVEWGEVYNVEMELGWSLLPLSC